MNNLKKITAVGALAALAMSLSGVAIARLAADEDRPSACGSSPTTTMETEPAASRTTLPVHDAKDDKGGNRPEGGSDDPARARRQ